MSRSQRTRDALLTAAIELFADRGYEATTTAAIAARAGVSEMTLFRHFPTKDALVVDDPYDPLIAAAVADRPADERALTATARGVRDAWRAVPPPAAEAMRVQLRLVARTPALRGAIAQRSRATEDAIADALAGRGVEALEGRVVAAAVIAGLTAALLEWSLSDAADPGTAIESALNALGDATPAATERAPTEATA